ncbi:hypothetical protein BDV26DRAFT_263870 [Aspergillus bertholletiae]|uniref:Uncharacterized protein n=1 Tax=Aspergillus bertholletiae TaxID=1226010 RepID=A0A5N7B5E9_9EURO|nr:hypothetical protein BDV26DRAFT_263870 [Aspergillus bertholletiae]
MIIGVPLMFYRKRQHRQKGHIYIYRYVPKILSCSVTVDQSGARGRMYVLQSQKFVLAVGTWNLGRFFFFFFALNFSVSTHPRLPEHRLTPHNLTPCPKLPGARALVRIPQR